MEKITRDKLVKLLQPLEENKKRGAGRLNELLAAVVSQIPTDQIDSVQDLLREMYSDADFKEGERPTREVTIFGAPELAKALGLKRLQH